jgi:hypothetical protein
VSFPARRNLRIAAGRVEADKCWIPIWCKDTGAAARVRATFLRGGVPLFVAMLDVPADGDTDQLPTNWEHAMVQEWNAQYQENNEVSEAFFGPTDDKEQRAPGPNETQQKTVGDRLTVLQEYRGFLLDGGGFGRDGTGGFTGQQKHVRLSPARKEALLEVDQTEKLDAPRQGEVAVYLDGAAKIWSKDAGVYVYYMLDESPMDTPPFKKTDTLGQVRDNERRYLKDHRGNPKNQPAVNAAIAQCFTHFILLSTAFDNYTRNEGAHTYSEATPGTAADQMGVYVYTAMLAHGANILTGTNDGTSVTAASYGASVIAHELMHMVIAPTRGSQGWDTAEHLVSDPTQSELMFRDRAAFKRFQFSTVAIGDKTLREIDLKGNPCLHP